MCGNCPRANAKKTIRLFLHLKSKLRSFEWYQKETGVQQCAWRKVYFECMTSLFTMSHDHALPF